MHVGWLFLLLKCLCMHMDRTYMRGTCPNLDNVFLRSNGVIGGNNKTNPHADSILNESNLSKEANGHPKSFR